MVMADVSEMWRVQRINELFEYPTSPEPHPVHTMAPRRDPLAREPLFGYGSDIRYYFSISFVASR